MKAEEITALEAALGYRFRRVELLEQALTHSSHAHESESRAMGAPGTGAPATGEIRDNEQLEFLGDAVLGFITSQTLFERFPHFQEGHLSKMRAHLVSARHLVQVAGELELGKYLRLGKGEEKSGGRGKSALLVNALEAVLAAMYLDGGLERARGFILERIVDPEVTRLQEQSAAGFPIIDYKSTLQEFLQAQGRPQPSYTVVKEEGPQHRKVFTVELRIQAAGNGKPVLVGRAEGPTKKRAEQRAARQALEELRKTAEREAEGGKVRGTPASSES